MNFCWVNSSKVELLEFLQFLHLFKDLVDELHENPVVVAMILLVEFCDFVRLELQGVRDEELFHRIQR